MKALFNVEAAYPVIQSSVWGKQTSRCPDHEGGIVRFEALGTQFDSITDAENSVKEKRQMLIKWMCEVSLKNLLKK